jgi:hypothetical protein
LERLFVWLHPQIDLSDLGGMHDAMRFALRDNAAAVEDNESLRDAEERVHDVFDPDDRDTRAVNRLRKLDKLVALPLCKAAGDFI